MKIFKLFRCLHGPVAGAVEPPKGDGVFVAEDTIDRMGNAQDEY